MDMGLGAIFEKFEEYFGRRITKALLVLVGLALVAACVSAIWTWLVAPILTFFRTTPWSETLIEALLAALGVGAGVAVGLFLISALGQWRLFYQAKRRMDQLDAKFTALWERAKKAGAATDATTDRSAQILEAAILLMRNRVGTLPLDLRAAHLAQLTEAERHLATIKDRGYEQQD